MVWCNTTRTDTIDFGILGHTTNNGSEQPYETLSKIIRHDQVLVVWNAPVPTTGRFPGSQLNTHKIAFPVSKNQWLPCPSGMRIIQCSLLTVTRSRRSSTCFPFTRNPSIRFRHLLSYFRYVLIIPSTHGKGNEKALFSQQRDPTV